MTPRLRQLHRWLSIAFTVAVLINLIALAQKAQAVWIGLLALAPLILLMVTGLWLFAQPYAARWRTSRAARRV
jgi:high-affinity Fe2+/Pb2+ permease